MKKIKGVVGDLINIPFKTGMHTYGRILIEDSYAIYDCPSSKNRTDYENIIQSSILFIAQVDVFAIRDGHWTIVENIPLEKSLKNFYPRYFNPSPTSINLNFYNVYRDEIEDAIEKDWINTGKIQLDGIHGHLHVEKRINDYYDRKKNESNRTLIEIFKKMSGLPLP